MYRSRPENCKSDAAVVATKAEDEVVSSSLAVTSVAESTSSSTAATSSSSSTSPTTYTIILYYKYTRVVSPDTTLAWQGEICRRHNLRGRIRIATEGINGTLAGSAEEIQEYIHAMNTEHDLLFAGIAYKFSTDTTNPFPALGLFNVKELTATGVMAKSCQVLLEGGVGKKQRADMDAAIASSDFAATSSSSAASSTSTSTAAEPQVSHLTPSEWHAALQTLDPETDLLLDTRNAYETAIGTFSGAVDPKLRAFAQLPEYVQQNLDVLKTKKRVLMFCTGGIRCEKASLYMAARTGAKVHQLEGGIHKYLDEYQDGGLFKGKNFVFDGRLAMSSTDTTIVGHCVHCATSCDTLSESILCRVCKTFVILCTKCKEMYEEKQWRVYCAEHILLAAGKDYDPTAATTTGAAVEAKEDETKSTNGNAAISSAAASSTSSPSSSAIVSSSTPAAAASAKVHPDDEDLNADADSAPPRPEDSWSPPSSDPGCPEQLNSFLSRFTTEQLHAQLNEIESILSFFQRKHAKSASRSRNRKNNLYIQRKRIEEYLNERRKREAKERGEKIEQEAEEKVISAAASATEQTSSSASSASASASAEEKQQPKKQRKRDAPLPAVQSGQLISFVPLLNV